MKQMLPKAKLQNMVIYIKHFELQKNKIGIALGFLSIDLIQREGVNCNYSNWKINCRAIRIDFFFHIYYYLFKKTCKDLIRVL